MQKKESAPAYMLDLQQNSNKNQMHAAISAQKLDKVIKLSNLYNFQSHEECSVKGHFWNCMHYAAHFRSEKILEYWLKKTYKLFPEKFIEIINEKTCEGWTPLMIAGIYNSPKCIEILFKCGGIILHEKDDKGKTALELTSTFNNKECNEMIQKEISNFSKTSSQAHTKINNTWLNDFKDEVKDNEQSSKPIIITCNDSSIEEDDRYRSLLRHGERLPCLICLCNKGLIKYTTCCGQPIHPYCKMDKIKSCPNCKTDNWELNWEVEYPERAFTL